MIKTQNRMNLKDFAQESCVKAGVSYNVKNGSSFITSKKLSKNLSNARELPRFVLKTTKTPVHTAPGGWQKCSALFLSVLTIKPLKACNFKNSQTYGISGFCHTTYL